MCGRRLRPPGDEGRDPPPEHGLVRGCKAWTHTQPISDFQRKLPSHTMPTEAKRWRSGCGSWAAGLDAADESARVPESRKHRQPECQPRGTSASRQERRAGQQAWVPHQPRVGVLEMLHEALDAMNDLLRERGIARDTTSIPAPVWRGRCLTPDGKMCGRWSVGSTPGGRPATRFKPRLMMRRARRGRAPASARFARTCRKLRAKHSASSPRPKPRRDRKHHPGL